MKKLSPFLLKKYAKMSGDKRVRLGLSLAKMARQVRKSSSVATGA